MNRPVTVIPGDGIGPECTEATRRVLAATGVAIDWIEHRLGVAADTDPLPAAALESIRRTGVALKGPISLPPGGRSVNIALKHHLDLFVQARPVSSLPGAPGLHAGVDLVVLRETTEDFYAGIEFDADSGQATALLGLLAEMGRPLPAGSAVSLKHTTALGARRMLDFSFRYARGNGRQRVTVVHKSAVTRSTDGLFLAVARDVATGYPDIEIDELAVDAAAAQLARAPAELDVLVMPGQYGDILSDLAAAVVGGVGLAPGANYGADIAMFEAVHGTAPRHAGRDRANPMALILSGALLLDHIGHPGPAASVRHAVAAVVRDGRHLTYDIARAHPPVGTARVTEEIIRRLDQPPDEHRQQPPRLALR